MLPILLSLFGIDKGFWTESHRIEMGFTREPRCSFPACLYPEYAFRNVHSLSEWQLLCEWCGPWVACPPAHAPFKQLLWYSAVPSHLLHRLFLTRQKSCLEESATPGEFLRGKQVSPQRWWHFVYCNMMRSIVGACSCVSSLPQLIIKISGFHYALFIQDVSQIKHVQYQNWNTGNKMSDEIRDHRCAAYDTTNGGMWWLSQKMLITNLFQSVQTRGISWAHV